MMANWRCNSCGATYNDDQPGGYLHACPPSRISPTGIRVIIPNPRDENYDLSDPGYQKVIARWNLLPNEKRDWANPPTPPPKRAGLGRTELMT